MKYGHVGRPTNQEVLQKKRKKMFKLIFCIVVIFIVCVFCFDKKMMNSLMGNSVIDYKYVCPSGWKYNGVKHTCSLKTMEEVQIAGDANRDFKLDHRDYLLIKNAVQKGQVLDNIDQATYDVNGDRSVDKNDLLSFTQTAGITSTGGRIIGKKVLYRYVCPYDIEIDGIKTTYKMTNDRQCQVTKTMKATKIQQVYNENDINEEYKTGDIVELNGEKYYTISDSDKFQKYITLLKADPLTTEEVNKYGGVGTADNHVNRYTVDSTGKAYDHKGYGSVAYYSRKDCGHTVTSGHNETGCTNDYNQSDIKYIVDNWANDRFKQGLLTSIDGYKARLINYTEFLNIGGYDWKYSKDYNYWSMEPTSYEGGVWQVSFDGYWGTRNVNEYIIQASVKEYMVVRPVINVNKSSIK